MSWPLLSITTLQQSILKGQAGLHLFRSDRWTSTADKKDKGHNQSDNKQYPGDIGRGTGDAAQAKRTGNQRNDEKNKSPGQHVILLLFQVQLDSSSVFI